MIAGAPLGTTLYGGIRAAIESLEEFYRVNVKVKIKDESGQFVDRTNLITTNSFKKQDILNNKSDRVSFSMEVHAGQTYRPDAGDEIIIELNDTREFGGVVLNTTLKNEQNGLMKCTVQCKDYVHFLDRKLVLESYENMTVNEIIQDLQQTYAFNFSTDGVDCDITVASVTFNRLTFSKCLKKLADLTNYSWYVDAYRDIKFFAKQSKPAPFSISENNGKYIISSFQLQKDISQIRNKIIIRGGNQEGQERTEKFKGSDATEVDTGGKAFNLASKFKNKPVVTVDGTEIDVGVEFIDDEQQFDAFWDYNQKYVRFKQGESPGDNQNVEATGNPLYPVTVELSDYDSIEEYGLYEFFKKYETITTREEGIRRARADLDAYAQEINEGSFQTYESGLRSGQIINVNAYGVNEDFIINKVTFSIFGSDKGMWKVDLVTLKTQDIIDVMQGLLDEEVGQEGSEQLLSFEILNDSMAVADEVELKEVTTTPYYIAPNNEANEDPDKNYMRINFSRINPPSA